MIRPDFMYDIEPHSEEWREARLGLITASQYQALMANGAGRESLILRCATELVTEVPAESYSNAYMERGKRQEAEALAKYGLVTGYDLTKCGFVRYGRTGCSPDALVGKDRGVQVKTMKAELLAKVMFTDKFPGEHYAQCQGEMHCTRRKRWDLALYSPGMPLVIRPIEYDRAYGARLDDALARAYTEVDNMVRRIRGYGK